MPRRPAFTLLATLAVCSCASPKPAEPTISPVHHHPTIATATKPRFHIETTGLEGDAPSPHYWIVTSTHRVPLPDLPHPDATTCPGANFTISPDQQWIFADEKLYHRANEVWLLHRDSELHYSLVGTPTFGRAALDYFTRATGKRLPSDYYFITRIGPWPDHGNRIRLTLYSDDWLDTALCYDLKTRKFSISDDQTTTYY
ncbi:hypothetical protein [Luteolibacter soli]|uniref:Lipoprotein n=1 Tax=Luteolibacter soli TaxID=3135280 RepID=A0ABU9AZ00_9BACT